MNMENEPLSEEELADRLWRAINLIQAITDRLLTQYEKSLHKSLREHGDQSYSLASLRAV